MSAEQEAGRRRPATVLVFHKPTTGAALIPATMENGRGDGGGSNSDGGRSNIGDGWNQVAAEVALGLGFSGRVCVAPPKRRREAGIQIPYNLLLWANDKSPPPLSYPYNLSSEFGRISPYHLIFHPFKFWNLTNNPS